ncbi:hypothetical protein LIT38_10295 [Bacillus sp. CMF12]|uniref:hypothetical protein n=1 Tax=Bacillus sp. CMF12 TaxID=2884834 RepID=UPI002079D54B|nr:hypothetical protein [Bacillus sp. CMF12]USK51800.1 hypothetical protein LIT38_10295 [Bacillus sp. CMF12]
MTAEQKAKIKVPAPGRFRALMMMGTGTFFRLVGWLGGFFWSFYGRVGGIGMICILLGIAYFLSLIINHGNSAAVEGYKVKRFS